jgi:DNA-binding NarL/FixJ family response regulator
MDVLAGDARGEHHRGPVQRVSPAVAPVRVILVEDDVLLRAGLAGLLDRSGFDVVGQAGDGAQLLALVRDLKPDLVLTDIRMPPTQTTEGLGAARVIRAEFPDIGILVLSAHVDVEHAMELLSSSHAIGYLLKSRITDVTDFIDTLERIAKGPRSWAPRGCRNWCPHAGAMTHSRCSAHASRRFWR